MAHAECPDGGTSGAGGQSLRPRRDGSATAGFHLGVGRAEGFVGFGGRRSDGWTRRRGGDHGAPLVGGNVTGSDQTSLTLTVLGAVKRGRALTRSGARAGDRIFVTGELGTSAFEVARAERGAGRVRFVPTPRLAAGRALARIAGVGGCIDVSDGLDADLAHLLAGTELAPELAPDRFPRPARFDTRCTRAGLDAELLLRSGGEDYELLFTARGPVAREALLSRRLGVRVSEIGAVRKGARDALPSGYRHF